MSEAGAVPPITSNESVARYIYYRSHLRRDKTVKPDAFIPYPYPDLSVTRHIRLSEKQLWEVGRNIAGRSGRVLCARADVQVFEFQKHELQVTPAPDSDNPNHANVTGWPAAKPAQKIIAQQIAAAAGHALTPPSDPAS